MVDIDFEKYVPHIPTIKSIIYANYKQKEKYEKMKKDYDDVNKALEDYKRRVSNGRY